MRKEFKTKEVQGGGESLFPDASLHIGRSIKFTALFSKQGIGPLNFTNMLYARALSDRVFSHCQDLKTCCSHPPLLSKMTADPNHTEAGQDCE